MKNAENFEVAETGTRKRLTEQDIEIRRLRGLVKMGEAVVEDFMPNIGKCALQDYGRLNDFLIEAGKIDDPE